MMAMVTGMEMEGAGEGTRCHQFCTGELRATEREARRGCSCPTTLKGRQRGQAARV